MSERPKDKSKGHITMAHGAGGAVMGELIKEQILKRLGPGSRGVEVPLEALEDSSVVEGKVLTTDSYVVKPIFFPGGDIGRLAVSGTVNDLAVMGCRPLALSLAFVIEEGLEISELETVLDSAARTSKQAGVPIITGDTKVVEKGALDKLIINTSGIGVRWPPLERNLRTVRRFRPFKHDWPLDSGLKPGDKIILSGSIGDHGIAILSFREGYGFESTLKSDVQPLNGMIRKALEIGGIVAMKDPTRGGLANALTEWSEKSNVGISVEESAIPVHEGVRSACEMLGLDQLAIGNEGKAIIGVVKEKAEAVLKAIRRTKEGKEAAIIGEATKDVKGVVMRTLVGGKRIVDKPSGDPIPRIC
jgi:hydrogenase expression/formation protein HypE